MWDNIPYMCPTEADIVLIEDNLVVIDATVETLKGAGHAVIAVLSNTSAVTEFLQNQPLANPQKTVFLVDGTLENGDEPGMDGEDSIRNIRTVYPSTPPHIIGRALNKPVEGADIQRPKADFSSRKLAQEINGL
jgi:CheY-like chemotaxis protein